MRWCAQFVVGEDFSLLFQEVKKDYGMTEEEFAEFKQKVDADQEEKQISQKKIEKKLDKRRQKKELKEGVKETCKTQ